jgi:glutathione S-transferase
MTNLTLIIGNKNYSSWSLRPWLAMQQAGIEFEEIRIPLYKPETRQNLLQYSPSGKVPVLIHGTLTVWESTAICEYVAELFPDYHWFPEDREKRAIARSISAEMHAGFVKLRQNMPMDCRARYPGKGMKPGVQEDCDRITSIWRECRQKYGSNGDFLFGHFTIADAMYAPVVSRFITYDVQLDSISKAYAEAIWSLPSMQQWVAAAIAEPEVITA